MQSALFHSTRAAALRGPNGRSRATPRIPRLNIRASAAAAGGDGEASSSGAARRSESGSRSASAAQGGIGARIKAWMQSSKVDKQKLAEYGMGAFAAYGESKPARA